MTSFFHLNCVRDQPPEAGPGTLIFTLRRPLALRVADQTEVTVMIEGEPLYVEPVACVRSAMARHLQGACDQSDFRRGIATLMDFDPLGSDEAFADDIERAIDIYSRSIAVVEIRAEHLGPARDVREGLFNRMFANGLAFALTRQEA